jgi:hypothetical protein
MTHIAEIYCQGCGTFRPLTDARPVGLFTPPTEMCHGVDCPHRHVHADIDAAVWERIGEDNARPCTCP